MCRKSGTAPKATRRKLHCSIPAISKDGEFDGEFDCISKFYLNNKKMGGKFLCDIPQNTSYQFGKRGVIFRSLGAKTSDPINDLGGHADTDGSSVDDMPVLFHRIDENVSRGCWLTVRTLLAKALYTYQEGSVEKEIAFDKGLSVLTLCIKSGEFAIADELVDLHYRNCASRSQEERKLLGFISGLASAIDPKNLPLTNVLAPIS